MMDNKGICETRSFYGLGLPMRGMTTLSFAFEDSLTEERNLRVIDSRLCARRGTGDSDRLLHLAGGAGDEDTDLRK
jgi:hypothetical protein